MAKKINKKTSAIIIVHLFGNPADIGKIIKISKDKLFFVGKNIPHYFHSNTKELKALYFFGGPDS